LHLVLQHRKFRQYFKESFAKISALKIESCHNIQNFGKNCNFKILSKMKILESIVYVISQLMFLGGREIAQEGGEIFPKVSPKLYAKFWEDFVSLIHFLLSMMSRKINLYYYYYLYLLMMCLIRFSTTSCERSAPGRSAPTRNPAIKKERRRRRQSVAHFCNCRRGAVSPSPLLSRRSRRVGYLYIKSV